MENLLEKIKHLGVEKNYPKGSFVFNAGDRANGFYYINKGEISVYKMDEQGKEIEINRLGSGDYLGEVILFSADIYPVFASVQRDSRLLFFTREKILTELNNNPVVAQGLLKLLAVKCISLNKRIETLSLRSVRQRLIQYLLSLCKGDGNCQIELKIKKGELAKLIGTVNETLSRNFRQLQDENLIKVNGNKIQILECIELKKELI